MSDHMKEAERLIECLRCSMTAGSWDEYRAALLAHIQRGAVPKGWQVVPSADQLWNNDEVMALNAELGLTMDQLSRLASAITRIAHPADWRERFSQAVYDDLAAADNQDFPLEEYPARILKVLDAVIGREIKPAPAGVPMPKPVAYGFGNTAITGHTNRLMMVRIDIPGGDQYAGAFWLPLVLADEAHTYGVACRAAGEAAGYVRGMKEASERIRRGREILDAALRGEVKP